MKPNVVQNADERWVKSSENSPRGVEGDPLREIPRKPSGWSSRVHARRGCQGSVRSAARLAVALGLVWVLVAFWAYPAHGWWRTIPGAGYSEDKAQALVQDAAGDVIAAGRISDNFAVTKLSGVTGEELWRQEIDGTASDSYYYDEAQAVAVDVSGDVIAGGYLYNSGTRYDFTVIKFSGGTGEELWRQEINGTAIPYSYDYAHAVAVDGSGDVIAAGYLYNSGTGSDFTVIKFSGATGEELWRQEINGTAIDYYDDVAHAVAVDGSGDVIAAGYLNNGSTYFDFTVIKFSGATGEELWRQEINGTGIGYYDDDVAHAVAVDGSGDVIAAGYLNNGSTYFDFTVIKFSGATGAELWRQEINGTGHPYFDNEVAHAVAVDASGDVIAAGRLSKFYTGYNFAVIKFSGGTGAELWRQEINGTTRSDNSDEARAVAVDGSGDVIAGGYLYNSDIYDSFAVIKFSGATGAVLWQQEIDGKYSWYCDVARAVAVDGSGDMIAAGDLCNTDRDFTVIKFSGAWGNFGETHTGRSLLVKDDASGPDRRQLKVVSKDPHWPVPPQGSANDPTLAGASLRLVNPSSSEDATLVLPPGPQWRVTSTASGAVTYLYRDGSGVNGPCIALKAISGKQVRAICKGSRGLIPFTLDEPRQGSLVVSVQFGAAEPQCTWFGGRVMSDQGTSNPGPIGIFKAKDAASRLAACPAPPSPSAAFLDATSSVLD